MSRPSGTFVVAHAAWVFPQSRLEVQAGAPRLVIWGERAGEAGSPGPGPVRTTVSLQGECYPGLVTPQEMLALLSIRRYLLDRGSVWGSAKILIPVAASGPELAADESEAGAAGVGPDAPLELRPFDIQGLSISTPRDVRRIAATLAGLLVEASSRQPGRSLRTRDDLIFAPDLLVWARACRFALELMARELIVPDCDERAGIMSGRALWRALRHPEVERGVCELAAQMPAVAVSDGEGTREWLLRLEGGDSPPGAEPDEFPTHAMWRFVDWVVDCAARTALSQSRTAAASPQIDFDPRPYFLTTNVRLVERWAAALHTWEGEFYLTSSAVKRVREAFDSWRRPEGALPGRLARLSLFLVPEQEGEAASPDESPTGGEGGGARDRGAEESEGKSAVYSSEESDGEPFIPNRWRLEYGLQLEDGNPQGEGVGVRTLFAHEVWAAAGDAAEALWGGLARASAVFEPLARSLREDRPTGCTLTASELETLLQVAAPQLERLDVVLRLPAWAARAPVPVRASVRVLPAEGPERLSLGGLLSYDWRIAIGETEVSPELFRRLVDQSLAALRLNGEWIRLDGGQIRRLLEVWTNGEHSPRTTISDLIARQEESERLAGVPVDIEGAGIDSAFERLLALVQGQTAAHQKTPPPEGLKATLRPYQEAGFAWLAEMRRLGFGACLADDMGLGKTLQVIALFRKDAEERRPGEAKLPNLVVCPTSVLENWRREIARFAPGMATYLHHGPDRAAGDAFVEAVRDVDVVLTSYALVPRDLDALIRVSWKTLVLDEAQLIKNPSAKQTQSVKRLAAEFRVALTGTPVENRLSELWSIMDFVVPGYLGSESKFRAAYARPIERDRDEVCLNRLKRLVRPFILRRVKTAPEVAADLPEKIETKRYCSLTPEQAALYQATVSEMVERIEQEHGMKRRGLIFSTLTRLKQICDHPALYLKDEARGQLESRSGKMTRLIELVDDVVRAGERGLVFTQFVPMGRLLQDCLERRLDKPVPFLHGGLSLRERDAIVHGFQRADGPPVLILSLRAGGVGLNLTQATHVFHYDRWWNPAVEAQATDRAFRIGQSRNVHVHTLICSGTLEDHIDATIESKKELADKVVESGENWLTELSTAELREIFALRR